MGENKEGFEPVSRQYGITVEELSKFPEVYQTRNQCEEVDLLETMGGEDIIKEKLGVNPETGLTSLTDIKQREAEFGVNRLEEKEDLSFWTIVKEAAGDLTLRILFGCGLISLACGLGLDEHREYAWIEGFAILVAVVIVIAVTSINDYRKQKKFRELQEIHKNRKHVSVLRNGVMTQLHPYELVVGDVVELTTGLLVPADGIVLQSFEINVSEAAITGENEFLRKEAFHDCITARDKHAKAGKTGHGSNELPSFVCLGGTEIREGKGLMMVTGVGPNSTEGQIMGLTGQEDEGTPLERKLDYVAKVISKFGLYAALVAVAALYLRFIIEIAAGNIEWDTGDHVIELIRYLIVGITILVVAIPEGLPLAVTLALAYSVIKMQKFNNLVKRMESCETMGGANMICSDKTGTLTSNIMTLVKMYVDRTLIDFEKIQPSPQVFSPDYFSLLKESIFTNTSAEDIRPDSGGNPTEVSFLKLLNGFGHNDWLNFRKSFKQRFYKMIPFNSKRKKGSVVITLENGKRRLHVMGAAERILSGCVNYLDSEANPRPLSDQKKEDIDNFIASMGSDGLRTITVAYKDIDGELDYEETNADGESTFDESELTLICTAGIKDPVRKGVPEAVDTCKAAGIKVRMITGDSKNTARAIALECHILDEEFDPEWGVMEGAEFQKITGGTICKNCRQAVCPCPRDSKKAVNGEELREDVVQNLEVFEFLVSRLDVLARSRPQDKYTMVTGLKQMGHVVAVTGDGTNDAPALKKADIGFAMGSGTEIARESADIILIDDNFVSIVDAVRWGRNIYDNIQKFIQFQLTVNVVAVVCAIVGAITIQQSPLTATQMLWVNLIMDTMASLALATAPPDDTVLQRAPQARNDAIITRRMWRNIFGMAVFQLAILFMLTFGGEDILPEYDCNDTTHLCNPSNDGYVRSGRLYTIGGHKDYYDHFKDPDIGPSRHFTYIFNIFVLMQLSNEINSRMLKDEFNIFKGLRKNPMFIYIWIFTLGVQALLVQVGSFALSCNKDGLSGEQWGICLAFGMTPLLWRMLLRLIPISCLNTWGSKEIDIQGEGAGALSLRSNSRSIERRRSSLR